MRVTALWHPVPASDRLREASESLHHPAAPGVEGPPGASDGEQLATHRRDLAARLQRGASPAPPVARVSSPKADGRQRPSGQPTREDTSVQRATGAVRKAVYEPACLGCSYGARPGRSPQQAWEAGTVGSAKRHSHWGLDADRRGFYDAMDHAGLGTLVEHRRGDQRVVRHMGQGLQAGGRAEGPGRQQAAGTPHGGSARPRRANVARHEGFDRGAAPGRRRDARGAVLSVRSCAACLVGFPYQDAAEPCLSDLRDRCPRVHRARPPDQTRRMECGRWASARRQRRAQGHPETCALLGVTHLGRPTRTGQETVRRKPGAQRLRTQLQEITQTLRARRPWPRRQLGAWRRSGLPGHARDAGGPRHMRLRRVLRAWLLRSGCQTRRRRRQRPRRTWPRLYALATPWRPPPHLLPPEPAHRLRVMTRGKRPVREGRTPGSVRGVSGNRHPYRDLPIAEVSS